ncbi:hypothetical protein GE061_011506 [Apolygus lucorum]|uniref:Uncharacterized protein n=1 Tax=Apolygus lucorum TaxID=248454 RepID=A0A8S9XYV7_APOLU|nr:hypothetical protein GE061_011506 [Apolygus lucorum]
MTEVKEVKKSKMKFYVSDDLQLLKLVLAENPFLHEEKWEHILKCMCDRILKPFTLRNIKDRVHFMMKEFKKSDRVILRKSGTEEEYREKDHLLEEVSQLQQEFGKQGRGKMMKGRANEGKDASDATAAAAETLFNSTTTGFCDEIYDPEYSSSLELAIHSSPSSPIDSSNSTPHPPTDSHTHQSIPFSYESPPTISEPLPSTPRLQLILKPESSLASHEPSTSAPLIGVPMRNSSIDNNKRIRASSNAEGEISYFLEELEEEDRALKRRALDVEERKLALEERRLNLQEKAQKYRMEIQQREMDLRMRQTEMIIANQQAMISIIENLSELIRSKK